MPHFNPEKGKLGHYLLNGSSYEPAFVEFVESLRKLGRHLAGEYAAPFGCTVKLEIHHEEQ